MRSRLECHQAGGVEISDRAIDEWAQHVGFDSTDRQRVDTGVQATGRIELLLDPCVQIGLNGIRGSLRPGARVVDHAHTDLGDERTWRGHPQRY